MTYDKSKLAEKTTTIKADTTKKFNDLDLSFLFAYKIFPDNILTFLTEWETEHRKMRIGDTIMQQVYLPPTKTLSQKLIFGVRINEIIDQTDKKGFSYESLDGHVEKGVSTFTVEQNSNEILFKIQTFSAPANFLTKIVGPIFSVPYQTFCTNAALKNVKRQLENQH